MGQAKVISFIQNVPTLKDFDPINNYCHWQILLNTEDSINDIKDVFIFVEDECTLNINPVGKGNILELKDVQELITESQKNQVALTVESLNKFSAKREA